MTIQYFKKYKKISQILTREILEFIENNKYFFELYSKFSTSEINILYNLLLFDINGIDSLAKRFSDIKSLGRDSSSLKSFKLKFGEEEGIKRYNKKCRDSIKGTTKDSYIEKYGYEDGIKKYKIDRTGVSLEAMINRYGQELGNFKWNEYLERYKKSHTLEGYIEKYGEIDGLKKFDERKLKYKKSNSLEGYIEKYGEIEGLNIWKRLIDKRSKKLNKEYLINMYGEEKASEIFKVRFGHTSLSGFKKRYGETEGGVRYNQFIENLRYKSSLEYLYDNFEKSEADRRRENKRNKSNNTMFVNQSYNSSRYSLVSQDLFWMIDQNIEDNVKCFFYTKNREFYIYNKETKSVLVYDFRYNNKIIEFNGDYFHCNPKIYDSLFYNNKKKMYSKEIWEFDKAKNDFAKKSGFHVLVVWQKDFVDDPLKTLNNCLNFLKNDNGNNN